tara:strand:+ start:180 stop:776 length:597 start_codon:yes stop_codon:yes gene_type:complete
MPDLNSYIPVHAVEQVKTYLSNWNIDIKVVSKRKSKHGDYRKMLSGIYQITINKSSNPYRFLITLIHELAHHVAFQEFGNRIRPHGKEWKIAFQKLMLPLINPTIFPNNLLKAIAQHFKNPKASSDTDFRLVMELISFDPITNKTHIFELEEGSLFSISNGRKFILGKRRVKRFECEEVSTQRKYVFSPHAEVTLVEK